MILPRWSQWPGADVWLGKPPMMAFTLFLMAVVPNPATTRATGLGKTPAETANDGDHAFLGTRSRQIQQRPRNWLGKNSSENRQSWPFRLLGPPLCQTPRLPATCLGKIHWKPPIMAISLYLNRDRANTGDNPKPVGKKSSGNGLSWRFRTKRRSD